MSSVDVSQGVPSDEALAELAARDVWSSEDVHVVFSSAVYRAAEPSIGWRAFAERVDRELLERVRSRGLSEDVDEEWKRLDLARAIARRHTGEPRLIELPFGEPWFAELGRDERDRVLAHVLQSASDGFPDRVLAYADAMSEDLRQEPRAAAPLEGAIGRAYAAIGEYDGALTWLVEATAHWIQTEQPASASFPLCEQLRVLGIRRDSSAIEALESTVAQVDAATNGSDGWAFVRLAHGRALAQVGALDAAEARLRASGTHTGPDHAEAARLRWLHYVALRRTQSDVPEQIDLLSRGAAEGRSGWRTQHRLARIDRALELGLDHTAVAGELLLAPSEGHEARAALTWLAPGLPLEEAPKDRELVARLAWTYRY
jgi:hypothetical protein